MAINQVIISGNLTRDAEGKDFAGGHFTRFTVAVNKWRKNKDSWDKVPNYVPCVMFGERAKKLEPILKKGMKVCVNGELSYSEWVKDDEKRSKLELLVKEVELMQKKDEPDLDTIPF